MTEGGTATNRAPAPSRTPDPRKRRFAFVRSAANWTHYLYRVIAAEISAATRYFDRVVQVAPLPFDPGFLLEQIDCPHHDVAATAEELPDFSQTHDERVGILLNGNFNYEYDIHELLATLKPRLSRTSRVFAVAYNPYLSWLYRLANLVGLRKCEPPTTFLTRADLLPIAKLTGYEIVKLRPSGYFPFRLLGLGTVFNKLLPAIPLVRWLGLTSVIVLQPTIEDQRRPSLAIVIPARNEKGNIEAALTRLPEIPAERLQIVFVEGHSSDGTWEEILRVARAYEHRYDIVTLRQTGAGKYDAVKLGFANATTDLLTILDADLTMPPELLPRFYEAWCSGAADFINGSRQVYPMEGEAMRFLNRLGNVFFAKALSFVLGVRLSDSLCGTKLLARHDYARLERWRTDFGDFDPFGDFELLFAAAILGFGIIDVPIRYRARTYGSTQISRFRHGWQLLRMTVIGFFRVRLGRTR